MTVSAITERRHVAAPTTPKRKRPAGLATPNGIPASTPGRTGTDFLVATGPLADILQPEIDKLSKTCSVVGNRRNEEEGGLAIICERASLSLPNTSSEAVIRRMYDIQHGKSRTTSTELADALLMAVDLHIEDQPTLATLPGGKESAREMVMIHFENTGEAFDEIDVLRLSGALLSFARGYVADCKDEDVEPEEWARRVASQRLKHARTFGRHPFQERFEQQEQAA